MSMFCFDLKEWIKGSDIALHIFNHFFSTLLHVHKQSTLPRLKIANLKTCMFLFFWFKSYCSKMKKINPVLNSSIDDGGKGSQYKMGGGIFLYSLVQRISIPQSKRRGA